MRSLAPARERHVHLRADIPSPGLNQRPSMILRVMNERVPNIATGSNPPPQGLRRFLLKRWVIRRRGERGRGGGRSSRISGTSGSSGIITTITTTTTSSNSSNRCSSSRLHIHLRFHEPLKIKAKMPVVFNGHQDGQAIIKHPRFG